MGQVRQGIRVRAEACAKIEEVDNGSCGAPLCLRRGAKQDLRGGEPFDDAHGSATDWAIPERVVPIGGRLC